MYVKEIYPTIRDTKVPIIIGVKLIKLTLFISKIVAPITAGKDKINEYFINCSLLIFFNNPIPIVEPLLEIPGINANPCAKPIIKEDL